MLAGPALADSTIVPDPTLTPGAVRTTDAAAICSTGTRQLRHWDRRRDDRIMAEYGLPAGPHPDFEIDHLVPLGIGGADAVRNLWPEPRRSIEPQWNAEVKDRLEWRLRDLICAGQLDVRRGPAHDGGGLGRGVRAVLPDSPPGRWSRDESSTPTPTSCRCSRARLSTRSSPTSGRTASSSRSRFTKAMILDGRNRYRALRGRRNRAAIPRIRRRRPAGVRAVAESPPQAPR